MCMLRKHFVGCLLFVQRDLLRSAESRLAIKCRPKKKSRMYSNVNVSAADDLQPPQHCNFGGQRRSENAQDDGRLFLRSLVLCFVAISGPTHRCCRADEQKPAALTQRMENNKHEYCIQSTRQPRDERGGAICAPVALEPDENQQKQEKHNTFIELIGAELVSGLRISNCDLLADKCVANG